MDNKVIDNVEDIANSLNDYFSNIGTNIIDEIIAEKNHVNYQTHFDEVTCHNSFFLRPTNKDEINNIILHLKRNTSPGHDNISVMDVLNLRESILEILVKLINEIFVSGTFPNDLKIVKVCPIHKSGSKRLMNNYRPISLISVFSKIIESIIKTQMLSFIEMFITPDPYQYGFLKGSSTLSATADLINYLSESLDSRRVVIAVFVDLRKAFDVVSHDLLLNKLEKMGFRGIVLRLIQTYLVDREQYVYVSDKYSSVSRVGSGVPQGSVLGPLLYSVYVLSLRLARLDTRYFTFADDTVLLYSNENIQYLTHIINTDLKKYYNWLLKNNLKINAEKTKFMLFKQRNKTVPDIRINLNDVELERVINIKYLGLTLDDDLGWGAHVDHVKSKIIPLTGALQRCKHFLTDNAKYKIYNAYFLSVLRYLLVVWGSCGVTVFNKIKVLQNKVLKILFNLEWRTHSDLLYSTLKITKINTILKIEQSKFIYRIINNKQKSNSTIKHVNQIHSYETRSLNDLYLENVRTTVALRSPLSESSKTFNSLPSALKNERSYNKFVRNLNMFFECYP